MLSGPPPADGPVQIDAATPWRFATPLKMKMSLRKGTPTEKDSGGGNRFFFALRHGCYVQ